MNSLNPLLLLRAGGAIGGINSRTAERVQILNLFGFKVVKFPCVDGFYMQRLTRNLGLPIRPEGYTLPSHGNFIACI